MNNKEAVKIAYKYFRDAFINENIHNLALEEIEMSDDGFWLITLGFDPEKKRTPMDILPRYDTERKYKVLKINNDTGKVSSLKIRNL